MKNKLVSIKRIIENEIGERIDTKNRRRHLTYARAIYCKAGRDLGLSFSTIGQLINRDHATIMHSVKVIFPFSQEDSYYRNLHAVISSVVEAAINKEDERDIDDNVDRVKRMSLKIERLQQENDALNHQLTLLKSNSARFTDLFEGLREEDVEEVYNKLNIFVKVIKSRVYL